jgi:hypothetical protein
MCVVDLYLCFALGQKGRWGLGFEGYLHCLLCYASMNEENGI